MPRRHDPFTPTAAELVQKAAERAGQSVADYAREQAEAERVAAEVRAAARAALRRDPTEDEILAVLNAHFYMPSAEEPLTKAQVALRRQSETDSLEEAFALPPIVDPERQPGRPELFVVIGEISLGHDLAGWRPDDGMYNTFQAIRDLPTPG